MKFEDIPIWDDPFVKEIRKSVDVDLDALNGVRAVKLLLETGSLDAETAAVLIAATGRVTGTLPAAVKNGVSLLQDSTRLFTEGSEFLFKAEDATVLKITLATLSAGTTGEGFATIKELSAKGTRKADLQKGVDLMTEISDRLIESGAHLAIEPKLVERFAEGLENMKQVEPFSSRRKMLNEAASALKYAIMQGAAAEVTHHAPRIDPDSQYARLKNDARNRFKL